MLYATNRFPGDGMTTKYEISFVGGYLDRAHVKAYIEWADLTRTHVIIDPANFLGPYTIKGFPVVPVGATLVIYRDTPKAPIVDFVNGSRLTESNLDTATRQGAFIAVEGADAMSPDAWAGVLNQLEGFSSSAETARDQAAVSADQAATARDDAVAAAGAIGPIKFYDTYAQAVGDIANLAEDDLVEVSRDETRDGARTRYKVQAGALVFGASLDQLRVDLAAAGGASKVGYTSAGTGAVATNVQSKLRELVSVGDYGNPDGIGTLTINVPSQFATIQAAFNWLANKTLAVGTTVTIQVADGAYTLTSGLNANHPQGSQIRLVGNETTPDNCVLTVSGAPTFDALTVSNGNTLGYLNGFRFTLASKAGRVNNYTAVLAVNGATIICGPKVKTNNWYYGIAARCGSFVSCDYAVVNNAGDVGIWAFVGSTVYCRYASSYSANDSANGYGYGFQAEYGSAMDCSNASASDCYIAGIASLTNSNLRATSATSSSNTGSGFLARDNGTIENHSSTAKSNARYGEERITGGVIHGSGVTLSPNTLGATSGYAYFDNSAAAGGRIAVNGQGRIDNNGAAGWFFNTSGGPQLEVSHTASTSAWPLLTGSSTGAPRIVAQGGAANLDFAVQAKGTGSVFLGNHLANYVRINPAAAGSAPSIYPEGSANLDLVLGSNGTGVVCFGKWSARADAAVNGFITIKDAEGNLRKLATIA